MDNDDDLQVDPSQKLFIGNLPPGATEAMARDWLEKFGTLKRVAVKTPNSGPAYAFVIYDTPESAQLLLQAKETHVLMGQSVDVQPHKNYGKGKGKKGKSKGLDPVAIANQTDPKIFVGHLPANPEEGKIRVFFEQFGLVTEVQMPSTKRSDGTNHQFCFVRFESMDAVHAVYENYSNNYIDGHWVDCRPSSKSTTGSTDWNSGKGGGPEQMQEMMKMMGGMMAMMGMMSSMGGSWNDSSWSSGWNSYSGSWGGDSGRSDGWWDQGWDKGKGKGHFEGKSGKGYGSGPY